MSDVATLIGDATVSLFSGGLVRIGASTGANDQPRQEGADIACAATAVAPRDRHMIAAATLRPPIVVTRAIAA